MQPFSLSAADLDHVLERTRASWESLRGGRLFITGGTGFFGMWLLESFLWANSRLKLAANVVALSRDPGAFLRRAPHLAAHPELRMHRGDVCRFEFPDGAFSHVIHAATEASAQLNEQAPAQMVETIVSGTQHTLDFAVHCQAEKFLLTSSGAVYGKQPADLLRIPEDYPGAPDPLSPAAAYGEGKRIAELLCAAAFRQHGLQARIARCFAFVGPYLPLDLHFAVGNFLRDALQGRPIAVGGDGTALRSYLYAADLAVWLWEILFRGQACRPYNVGSDQSCSIREVAEGAAQLRSIPLAVRVAQTPVPGQAPAMYIPAVDRARHELDLRIDIPFSEALRRTFVWHQQAAGLLAG